MHAIVLGAGVVGLTTAWYLQADGHQVTVIERNDDVASETSFANGGQLSYSYVAPLAGPGVLSKLPKWLLRRDSPIHFRPASISSNGAGCCSSCVPARIVKAKCRRDGCFRCRFSVAI
jgi:glycine/D-amino acid oxidase-like deaminating enzyme